MPWEACTGAGSWQDLWTHGGPTLEWLVPEGLCPMGRPTLEQFVRNCSLWVGFTLEKFMEHYIPWEGSHAKAGEECEEEGVAVIT